MKLRDKQVKFAQMLSMLISQAFDMGYEVVVGDVFRDARVHGVMGEKKGYGHPSSCHKICLAADINLFKNGKYLTETEDHKPLGEWWESIGGTWGGRFNDGNHYSLEHEGHK